MEASNAPKSGVRRPHLTKRVLRGLLIMDNQRRGVAPARISRFDETALALAGEWVQKMVDWYAAQGLGGVRGDKLGGNP